MLRELFTKKPIDREFSAPWYDDIVRKPLGFLTVLGIAVFLGLTIAKKGIFIGIALPALYFMVVYLIIVFRNPVVGMYTVIFLAFFAIGILRYVKGIPLGLSIDGVMFLTYLALIFKKYNKPNWAYVLNPIFYASLVWFFYNFLELFNPEARSRVAWFYAMRGTALYMLMWVPLVTLLWDRRNRMYRFLDLWFGFAILGVLVGIKQDVGILDRYEQAWLDGGAAVTHVLFGELRVFSFYSDAGQYGASMAHTGVVACILFLTPGISTKRKYFYLFTGLAAFWGMLISGTRGAMAVPALGFMVYLFLSKNIKILIPGLIVMMGAYGFLKYTTLLQNVKMVSRMRTALDPNNPSLLVRIENQRKLAVYLRNKPFGGGVGSAGSWGMRFSPGTFLAETPTDSWFVKIWVEEGIVGLYIHLGVLFYAAIHGGYYIWVMKDMQLRQYMMAFHSGMMGIYAASYGNGVLGQMPTGILMYSSMAFLFLIPRMDREPEKDPPKEDTS